MKTLFHSVYSLNIHLVLVTKYRRKCITQDIAEFLKSQFERLLLDAECELMEFNGEPDHLHLLISVNPKVQPSKLVNTLKTVTSRLVRKQFEKELSQYYWKPVFWSRSYCVVSCGGAPLSIIKQYLEQQQGFE